MSSPRIKNNKTYLKYTGYLFGVSKNIVVNRQLAMLYVLTWITALRGPNERAAE